MQSVLEILGKCEQYFAKKGVPSPKLDAQLLLAKAVGCKRLELFLRFDMPLGEDVLATFRDFARRRAKREPLQHILGDADFFGINLKCDCRALVPRHETEELCQNVADLLFPDASRCIDILDLGTGSGAIALGLAARYANARVTGVDISADALALARENLEICAAGGSLANGLSGRVNFLESNWFSNIEGSFDLIAANPPYLTEDEFESAQPEVKNFDPHGALVSGQDGLCDLRKILSQAPAFLKNGGKIICECGLGQPKILAEEFSGSYSRAETLPDFSHRERFVIFEK